jgi:D-alanyl-D-alanine carboxypeptidase
VIRAILLLLVLAGPAAADDPVFTARAAAVMQSHLEAERFSGAVLVAVDGKPIFRQGFGFADREGRIPNTPETRFRTGSIGKQFAAASVLQLVERGKLGLDDPISTHYERSPAAWSKITLRHLLSMRSGIFNFTKLPDFDEEWSRRDHALEEVIALTRDRPLRFEPGSRYEYSNSGYTLIGHVIEKATGQAYGTYLRDNLFAPLGMRNSGYEDEAAARTLAKGYVIKGGEWKIAPTISMSVVHAAGATYTTVDDLLRWEQALGSGKLLGPDSTRAMFTDYGGYGLAWGMRERLGYRVHMHSGHIYGFHTMLCRYPDDGVTIIVLANLWTASVSWIANELAALHFGVVSMLPRFCFYES